MNAAEFYKEQEMGYENDSEDILLEYCAKDMIQFAEDYFIAKSKYQESDSLPCVSVSLLKKAYGLIPDGTSHEDLIEIKQALKRR